jgi:hypothetical protein
MCFCDLDSVGENGLLGNPFPQPSMLYAASALAWSIMPVAYLYVCSHSLFVMRVIHPGVFIEAS